MKMSFYAMMQKVQLMKDQPLALMTKLRSACHAAQRFRKKQHSAPNAAEKLNSLSLTFTLFRPIFTLTREGIQ